MTRSSRSGVFRTSHRLIISLGLIYVLFFGALPLPVGAQTLAGRDGAPSQFGRTPAPSAPRDTAQFNVAPPAVRRGAPDAGLPNLRQLRAPESSQIIGPNAPDVRANPEERATDARGGKAGDTGGVRTNLLCADCGSPGGGSGYPSGDLRYSRARNLPQNETGRAGEDLGSRNFNWSAPLLGLPGRAGLDLSLSLVYNSLVWTKEDGSIKYNADRGFPAPGFALGFPKLHPLYQTRGGWAFMLVAPSGGRTELFWVDNDFATFEARDGSYLRLNVTWNGSGGIANAVARTTDGTQMTFAPSVDGELRCTEIKDRNGNYISVAYDGYGHPTAAIDTLGRGVDFLYNADGNLQYIRQNWGGVTHTWAEFGYGQVHMTPNFPGLTVNGPQNADTTVLTRVTFADGAYYEFDYTLWGQARKIRRHLPNGDLLNYVAYNVESTNAAQTDCPRYTQRKDWAQNWNNGAEATTSYAVYSDRTEVTAPDGTTVYKEFFAPSGWSQGLTVRTEEWANGARKKWTTTAWTQDNTVVNYPLNPRPTELTVNDDTNGDGYADNVKRTTIAYAVGYSLPTTVAEYKDNGATLYRSTWTTYNLDSIYTDRRIIGLPESVQVYDGNYGLLAKTTYGYDVLGWNEHLIDTPAAAVQHDRANYGPDFRQGRGNLFTTVQWDATDPNNDSKAIADKLGYYVTGTTHFTRDHLWHQNFFTYNDSYADGNNSRNTFAYPTTVTDADGYSSTAQYNYNFGSVTRTQTPAPAGQAQGAIQTMTYDTIGRRERVTTENNGAYTRWEYPNYTPAVQQYSTLQGGAGEAYEVQMLDGRGAVRAAAASLPNSVGGFRGENFLYDVMGRRIAATNPTEMNTVWQATGDDAAGWVYTWHAYDWKGRLTSTANPDGSTRENVYTGCGCAGGDVVTMRDEAGRRKRLTNDTFGRLVKAEELDWNGNLYAATDYSYNARDQLTTVTQGSGASARIRTLAYNGLGQLAAKTTPEQGTLSYSYSQDRRVTTMTDARGVVTTFGYNGRGLVTVLIYSGGSGVVASPYTTFGYDAAGNRTQMSAAGQDTINYSYDQLSRLTSEAHYFNGLGTSYTLNYGYNLGGQLTSVNNPTFNTTVGYTYDHAGQVTGVTGSGGVSAASYIGTIGYRAFGTKSIAYGNGKTVNLSYNNRLFLTRWDTAGVLGYDYRYDSNGENGSGRPDFADNLYDATLDRSWFYDAQGRLEKAYTGGEANHQGNNPNGNYAQGFSYDQWGNMTQRYGWGGEHANYTASYNNKNQRPDFTYDAAGNLLNDGGQSFTYNAIGQQATASFGISAMAYDGDGLRIKKTENGTSIYYLRSTALGGQVVAEINQSGSWTRGHVYLGGQTLAIQDVPNNRVLWVHQEPYSKAQRLTDAAGAVVSGVEVDPFGGETNRSFDTASVGQKQRYTSYERDGNGGDEAQQRRYERWHSRFYQPDPFDGSYDLTNPQSLNRYSYVGNDPVSFTDPTGLFRAAPGIGTFVVTVGISGSDRLRDYYDAGNGGDFGWLSDGDLGGTTRGDDWDGVSLEDALNLAGEKLKDPASDCAKLFSKGNGLDKLKELRKKGKIRVEDAKIGKDKSGKTVMLSQQRNIAAVAQNGRISVNPNHRILTSTETSFNKGDVLYGLSPIEALSTLLIHELLHITGDFAPDGPGTGDPFASYSNTLEVKEKCFGIKDSGE